MKKLLSKNRFLVVTTVLTLVISLGLMFFIYQTDMQRISAIQELENLKRKVQRLNFSRPSPTKENIKLINQDLEHIKLETKMLEEYFGQVYNNALNSFISYLQTSNNKTTSRTKDSTPIPKQETKSIVKKNQKVAQTESDDAIFQNRITVNSKLKQSFLDSWKKFIEEQKKTDEALEAREVLNNFRIFKKYPEDKFNNAKIAFLDEYKKNTLEKISDLNVDDYILAALGFPLDFTRISCKKFVEDIKKAIEIKLRENKIISHTANLILFDEFTTIPNDDQIPYIIKYCRLYEDLFTRLADSKIEGLTSYKKLNGLRGTKKGDYLIYQYEIQFVASLNSARNFLNSLQNAFQDNRIYIIKNISMINTSSNAEKLQTQVKKSFGRINGIKENSDSKSSSSNVVEKPIDNKEVVILLGSSDLVKVNIVFDYIIYNKPLISI